MTDKKKIDKLIEKEKPNSFKWHFLSNFWYKGEVFGDKLSQKEYIIWTSHSFTGLSHPIFKLEFNSENNVESLKTEINPLGKVLSLVYKLLAIGFLLLFTYLSYESGDLESTFVVFLIFGTIILTIYFLSRKMVKNEVNYLEEELKLILGKTTEEEIQLREDKKSEWNLSSTFFRLITYPISILIIGISIWMFYNKSLTGLVMFLPLTYLYSDIKILMRKYKLKNKK